MNVICPHACADFPDWDAIQDFLELMAAGNHKVTFPITKSSATSDIIGQLFDRVQQTFRTNSYTLDMTHKKDDFQRYHLSVIVDFNGGAEE